MAHFQSEMSAAGTKVLFMKLKSNQPAIEQDSNSPRVAAAIKASVLHSPISPSSRGILSSKYILYLEPSQQSSFYSKILEFYQHSKMKFGHNEAHMYHPHCSMTGFFDLPVSGHPLGSSWQDHLEHRLNQLLVSVEKPSVSKHSLHVRLSSPRSLSIRLNVSEELKQLVYEFKRGLSPFVEEYIKHEEVEELRAAFTVRQKPMDHISLAYTRPKNVYKDNEREFAEEIDEDSIREMHRLAEEMKIHEQHVDEWFVVLHKCDYKSDNLNTPHKFREVKRWKVV